MQQGILPHVIAHALGQAYNAVFHDPYLKYMPNQGVLKGVPNLDSWYRTYAGMGNDLTQLSPLHQAILRSTLQGSGINANMLSPASPIMQMAALRALNPQNARLG